MLEIRILRMLEGLSGAGIFSSGVPAVLLLTGPAFAMAEARESGDFLKSGMRGC